MFDGGSGSLLWLISPFFFFDLNGSVLLTLHHRHSALYILNLNERCSIHSNNSLMCYKHRITKICVILSRIIYVPCLNNYAYTSSFNMVGIVDSSS
jgi:hypothetical protein